MNFLYKAAPLGELTDYDEKNSIVKGYGSYFDNKDSDQDIIRKGAYKKTIEENGERVKYLYQHNMMQPIGKMEELYEDEKGLVFVASIPKTALGNDVIELMKAGVITENSVGIKGEKNLNEVYKRYDNLCKLLRKGNVSDDMGYAIESELLKLKTLFISATQPIEEITEPVE